LILVSIVDIVDCWMVGQSGEMPIDNKKEPRVNFFFSSVN
jgi:hypothetical protein